MIASLKNSSLSGGAVIDNGTLTIDSENNRIGINASSITDTLTVIGTVEVDAQDAASSFDYSSLGAFTVRTTTEDDPLNVIRYSTSGGATINIRRSNTDTLGSLSPVLSGGMLGTFSFGGYNSSAYDDGAQIRGYASENWSATAQGSNLRFYTNPIGGSAVVERMRIDPDGLITGSGPSLGAFTAFTATIGGTGWAIGDGTIVTSYMRIGKLVIYKFAITFGTTSTYGSASLTLTLPVTMGGTVVSGQGMNTATFFDSSLVARYAGNVRRIDASTIGFNTVGTNGLLGSLISTSPFTWAVGDAVYGIFIYEAA